jgi:hypothetical protein
MIKWISAFVLILVAAFFAVNRPDIKTDIYTYANTALDSKDSLPNIGVAPFAIAHPGFRCREFLSSIQGITPIQIAFLYNTFGKESELKSDSYDRRYDCLKKTLNQNIVEYLDIHLMNNPGLRNNRLENHEFLWRFKSLKDFDSAVKSRNNVQLKRDFIKYTANLRKFLAKHLPAHTQCRISPVLESNLSWQSGKILVNWTRELFPNCRVIWNPLGGNSINRRRTGADYIEDHGLFPLVKAPCIVNTDGLDIGFPERKSFWEKEYRRLRALGVPNVSKNWINSGRPLQQYFEEFANRCETAYFWVDEYNCLDPDRKGFIGPTKRQCSKYRSIHSKIRQELIRIRRNGVRFPAQFIWTEMENISLRGCSSVRKPNDGFKKGFLLKQSEFSNRGGVVIAPSDLARSKHIRVIHRGRVIDTYNRSGNFTDGRPIYRSTKTPLSYPFQVVLRFSNNVCYKVDNPRIRND